MKSICLGIVLVLGLFSCLVVVSCKAGKYSRFSVCIKQLTTTFFIEPIPIQMKDDNVTMPHLFNEVIPDLDRSESDCGSISILKFL